MPTPFNRQEELDIGKLRAAFARWLDSPLTGFVTLGSSGEAPFLDEAESERLIEETRQLVPKDRPLIVGTGRESTRATIAATRRAGALGADAVLVRTPGFFKAQMTAEAFVAHYDAVAESSPVPVLLYNFAAVTGVEIPVSAVRRLSSHPNIIGMKESGGDVARLAALINETSRPFQVLTGSAITFYVSLCVGAVGGILALAAVVPDACETLFQLVRSRRYEEAREQQERLTPLARLLGSAYGVPGLKAALKLSGVDVGPPRLPLTAVDESMAAALKQALSRLQGVPA